MSKERWKSERKNPAVSVRPKLPHSPAKDYFFTDMKQVGVEVVSDEPDFNPLFVDGSSLAEVFFNSPSENLLLTSNSSSIVDCGFSIKIPPGYRCRAESINPSLFITTVDSSRFKLNIFNAGEELRLIHKQKVARIWIEPMYLFELIIKEKDE